VREDLAAGPVSGEARRESRGWGQQHGGLYRSVGGVGR
jgi:hypothetical protein